MTINSSGIISTPARPAFYAYGDDGWTGLAAINTYYIGGFDGDEFNIGSHYNTSTKRELCLRVVFISLGRKFILTTVATRQCKLLFNKPVAIYYAYSLFTAQQQAGDGTIGITRIYNALLELVNKSVLMFTSQGYCKH